MRRWTLTVVDNHGCHCTDELSWEDRQDIKNGIQNGETEGEL